MSEKIGYYICHCGINISSKVRCREVVDYIKPLPGVVVAKEYQFMCSDPGQEMLEKDIAEHGLTRIVVASCSPRMHEVTFRGATERGGLNPFGGFHQVCVREHVSWVHPDEDQSTLKAKQLSRAGVQRVVRQRDLQPKRYKVNPNTLVVGGGIAGMQAALDIASAGHHVYLVEKEPTIGGHMLQYDKTFPTLDCAACIGTPKMVQVGQSKNIELYTYAEVEKLSGFVGNYKVTVRKKARYVDAKKCTGCGDCSVVCPVEKLSEWDAGMRTRAAIYRPFPQAVPITFTIDKYDRAPCQQTCPAGTNVQGYLALIQSGHYVEATQLIMEALPFPASLGRVCPAPCEAHCRRVEVDSPVSIRNLKRFAADQVDLRELPLPAITPQDPDLRVAVIGSGPAGLSAAYFLARMGYPVTVFEALSLVGGMMRTGIPSYRLPPAVLESEVAFIRRLGVEIRTESPIGSERTVDQLFAQGYKAVFAATGAHKEASLGLVGEDAQGILSGIAFLKEANLSGTAKVAENMVVIGGGAVAMDVARTAIRLGAKRVTLFSRKPREQMVASPEEIEAALLEGVQINNGWAPRRFLVEQGEVRGVEFMRSVQRLVESGRQLTVPDEGQLTVATATMVVLAIGQRPDVGWAEGSADIPLDGFGFVQIDTETFATKRPGLFAGGEVYSGPSIVVEAVANGHEAAISIDRHLRGEDLRAGRPSRPRGSRFSPIPSLRSPDQRAEMPHLPKEQRAGFAEVELGFSREQAHAEATRCLACGACSECMLCVSACKAEAIDHSHQDELVELEVGAVVVATGFDVMDPTPLKQYGYGRYNNVFTNLEFERLCNATGPSAGRLLTRDAEDRLGFGKPPEAVAILHCMGSRDKNYHRYCSRTCCMYALKYAHLIKDRLGHAVQVYNFYIDMRCVGKGYEEFYERTQSEGVHMIRGKAVGITDRPMPGEDAGRLFVTAEDTLSQRQLRIPVDMAVLCTAMEARPDAAHVARLFGITLGSDGFFLEEHPKLEPVSTSTAGVFIAGACQGPKDIPETVAQARAAASMAQALISKGEVEASPVISEIDPDICAGCQVCIALCPYNSIEFDERRHVSVVNGAVCKGCGSCAAHCPSGAPQVKQFTETQLSDEIEGLLFP